TGNRPLAGRDYPADLAQLLAWFSDDESCVDYLQWLRWPEGICCPRCLSAFVNNEPDNRFRCKKCWYRFSATAGTVFDKTRTPLTVWFQTAWLMTAGKSGVCAAHLHRVLPISSYQTAWSMLGKLRSVMSTQDSSLLSGRVEVDESFFGGHRPGRTGRGAAGKTLVAG
ncbi:IS1595-like element ISAar1 family transposase, partial [Glutamicibacter arilaitensis]